MTIIDIIEKKKQKQVLTEKEINFFINGYTKSQSIKDYHAAALLMAILLNGFNDLETYYFTKAILNSGKIIDFKQIPGIKIDKHSTGGVGDKVSLILAPICVALGLKVCKASGSGLGHTGGTLDKLMSIRVKTNLSKKQYFHLLKKDGMFIISQTPEICPADKPIYMLRNATATIDTLPLIAASVVAKKLAFKSDYVFIDIKVGSGAFCTTIAKAKELARIMMFLFKKFKHRAVIHLTDMSQPLGTNVGNAIEVVGAIDYLKGHPENSAIKDLIDGFIVDILLTTKKAKTPKQAQEMIDEVIQSGKAYQVFKKWAIDQGSSENILKNKIFRPAYTADIKASKSGYIKYISTKEIGTISLLLGAGRLTKDAWVDLQAGIKLHATYNNLVKKNQIVASLYSSKPIDSELIKQFHSNIAYSNKPYPAIKQIIEVIK